MFRTVLVSSVTGRSGARVSNRDKVILINLIHGKNRRLKVYQTHELNDAMEKAELIANKLQLKIYDATTSDGKWLN